MVFDSAHAQRVVPSGMSVRLEDLGSVAVLSVVGEIDLLTAPTLEESIKEARDQGPELLVVDLSGVEFLGSVGLSVLIGATERVGVSGRLRLVAAGDTVLRPMELTGIAELFSIYATRDEALAGG